MSKSRNSSNSVKDWLAPKSIKLPSNVKDSQNKNKPVANVKPNISTAPRPAKINYPNLCTSAPTVGPQKNTQVKTQYKPKTQNANPPINRSNATSSTPPMQINIAMNTNVNHTIVNAHRIQNCNRKPRDVPNKSSCQQNYLNGNTSNASNVKPQCHPKPKKPNADKPKDSSNQAKKTNFGGKNNVIIVQKNITIYKK